MVSARIARSDSAQRDCITILVLHIATLCTYGTPLKGPRSALLGEYMNLVSKVYIEMKHI